jgi:peptide deformylase
MSEQEVEPQFLVPSALSSHPIIVPSDPERWPLLEVPSQEVTFPISDTDANQIAAMDAVLDELDELAAGLAAIQIGYPKQIFLLRNGPKNEQGKPTNKTYINPVITFRSKAETADQEACLSIPGLATRCKRPKEVKLRYQDIDGNTQEETFIGFWSRAVMHEMDHLRGTLILAHLEHEMGKSVRRTKFGMKLTPHRLKVIANRRRLNKNARKERRRQRIG